MLLDPQTIYTLAGATASALLLGGAFARAVARQTTANALAGWRETAAAQEQLVETLQRRVSLLETQIATLQHQADADKVTILRLTAERDQLRRKVRQLTARVADLERHVTQAEGAAAATP